MMSQTAQASNAARRGRRIGLTMALTAIAATNFNLSAQYERDLSNYTTVTLPGVSQPTHLFHRWSMIGGLEQSDYGDNCQSMAVDDNVIYITDTSTESRRSLRRRYTADANRLPNLELIYPDGIPAPQGAINHVGHDDDGLLYVMGEVTNSTDPVVNLDIFDPATGEVTKRIGFTLKSLTSTSNYQGVTTNYIGHPHVAGSLTGGTYTVVFPEIFTDVTYDNSQRIRAWRIYAKDGTISANVSKLLVTGSSTEFIKFDNNTRMEYVAEREIVVDNSLTVPLYFHSRNTSTQVKNSLNRTDDYEAEASAIGVKVFDYNGNRLLVYSSSADETAKWTIALWKDTAIGTGLDTGNIEPLWLFPDTDKGLGYVSQGSKHVSLIDTAPDPEGGTDIYLFNSGNGVAKYTITEAQSVTTSVDKAIGDGLDTIKLDGRTLTTGGHDPIEVFTIDGRLVATFSAALSHDLSALAPGFYLLHTASGNVKLKLK